MQSSGEKLLSSPWFGVSQANFLRGLPLRRIFLFHRHRYGYQSTYIYIYIHTYIYTHMYIQSAHDGSTTFHTFDVCADMYVRCMCAMYVRDVCARCMCGMYVRCMCGMYSSDRVQRPRAQLIAERTGAEADKWALSNIYIYIYICCIILYYSVLSCYSILDHIILCYIISYHIILGDKWALRTRIDQMMFFVRRNSLPFLPREPGPSALGPWSERADVSK